MNIESWRILFCSEEAIVEGLHHQHAARQVHVVLRLVHLVGSDCGQTRSLHAVECHLLRQFVLLLLSIPVAHLHIVAVLIALWRRTYAVDRRRG